MIKGTPFGAKDGPSNGFSNGTFKIQPIGECKQKRREEEALFEDSKDGELAAKRQELPVERVLE